MAGWEGRRRLSPRQSSFRTIALLTLIPVAALLGLLLWSFIALTVRLPPPAAKPKKLVIHTTPAPPPPPRGRIVLIL
ncbi:MAG TPA: hypothetical protein VKH35_06775, partial [Thermoanaerobaculia bacterium]|nr:hypothetical protein [Thermoanaerobaculia bacterium]